MRIENPFWGPAWPSVRARWPLDPERVHLNHGSFGAVPTAVLDHQEVLRRRVERNPVRELWLTFTGGLEEARHAAAAFLGADPDGFAFVPNATTGVNAVLWSLGLGHGDEVLVTDHAYGAVRYAVDRACAKAGATVVVQPFRSRHRPGCASRSSDWLWSSGAEASCRWWTVPTRRG